MRGNLCTGSDDIIQKREERRAWSRGVEKWGRNEAERGQEGGLWWGWETVGSQVKEAAFSLSLSFLFLKFLIIFGKKRTELEVITERQREWMRGQVGGAEGALTRRASDLNRSLISVCKLQRRLAHLSPLSLLFSLLTADWCLFSPSLHFFPPLCRVFYPHPCISDSSLPEIPAVSHVPVAS